MILAPGVASLELPAPLGGSVIHPVVLWDSPEDITLVDAGFPGQLEELRRAFSRLGLSLARVRRILVTHQDLDHTGSLAEVVRESGAEVWAHPEDAPYISGALPRLKSDPSRHHHLLASVSEEQREQVRRLLSPPPPVAVNRYLQDGELLPLHGGIRVLHTPGHTPGHVSLVLVAHGLLLAGDALQVRDGQLVGPSPQHTLDMPQALASLAILAPNPWTASSAIMEGCTDRVPDRAWPNSPRAGKCRHNLPDFAQRAGGESWSR